jgi:hypothetical protein
MTVTAMEKRLATLRAEFDAGQKMLATLEARETELRQTLQRIGGAIQVLEELLAEEDAHAQSQTKHQW